MAPYSVLHRRGDEDPLGGKLAHDLQCPWKLDEVVALGLENVLASLRRGDEHSLRIENAMVANQAVVGNLVDPLDEFLVRGLLQHTSPERKLARARQMAERTQIEWVEDHVIER